MPLSRRIFGETFAGCLNATVPFVATVGLPEKAHPFGRQSLRLRCVWVETGIDGRLDLLDQLGPRRLDVADGLLTQLLAALGQIGQLFLAEVLLHGFVHGDHLPDQFQELVSDAAPAPCEAPTTTLSCALRVRMAAICRSK